MSNELKKNNSKTFEEKLIELENIVKKLEGTDMPLNEAIQLFESGIKLSKELEDELKNAELKIVNLLETKKEKEKKENEENHNELNFEL
ncbi:MAG TPA: exodeoxyribonuclease VII small subunit [bacterium]|nr:exodeoxyribonuclease VII small subunit [bacterium]HOL48462.1 exodeoxyribonuclease VII small subunit [bacterium]HPQ19960.1 exodeoxyribonuclease VII small subunit [bacterium]